MITEFIIDNIGYPIATGVGALIQFIIHKRKNNAEAAGVEIDNDTRVVDKWKEWADKMETTVSHLTEKLDKQRIECDQETRQLQEQITMHERRIFMLEAENHQLQKKIGDT